jgi:hypothetical protein
MKTRSSVLLSILTLGLGLAVVAIPAPARADGGGSADAGDAGDAAICVTDSFCSGKNLGDMCGTPGEGGGCELATGDSPSCFEGPDAATPLSCQLIYEPSDAGSAGDSGAATPLAVDAGATTTLPTVGCAGKSAGDACIFGPSAVTAYCFAVGGGLTCEQSIGAEIDAGVDAGAAGDPDDGGCSVTGDSRTGSAAPALFVGLALLVPFAMRRRKRA